jgi:hypothetical protein
MAASWRESGSSVTAVDEVGDDVEDDPREPKESLSRRPRITAKACFELGLEVLDFEVDGARREWESKPGDGTVLCAGGALIAGAKP